MEITLTKKIKATPEEIYRALTNPFTIQLWTDQDAVMEEKEGKDFSLFNGDITGKNMEFRPNELIRQVWYFDDKESEVVIKIFQDKNYSQVRVEQTNIPAEAYENILSGWKESLLGPLADFFEA